MSMVLSSKVRSMVTLTTYSVIESALLRGGPHETLIEESLSPSTSTFCGCPGNISMLENRTRRQLVFTKDSSYLNVEYNINFYTYVIQYIRTI